MHCFIGACGLLYIFLGDKGVGDQSCLGCFGVVSTKHKVDSLCHDLETV